MHAELFTKIIDTLENRRSLCEQHLKGINNTDDLRLLTVEQAQTIQAFCKAEEALMTKFVQVDLYHIIGMGNLSPTQMMKFTYLVHDYLQYRSLIKTLAFNFDKISVIPNISATAAYKTHTFAGVVLRTGKAEDTIPTTERTEETKKFPYEIKDNVVFVPKNNATKFIAIWRKLTKANFLLDNFMQKALVGALYGGILWQVDAEGNFIGTFETPGTFESLVEHYKAAQSE